MLAFSGVTSALTVNAPANVTLCTPTNITWQGGLPPFEVAISASGGYEQRYEDQFNHSFIWATALSDSEVVKVTVTDKNGISAESPSFVAHTNPNVQCIGLAAPLSPTYSGAAASASENASASGSSAQALSTGAVAGIAVGAGVVGFGAIAALAAVCLRRRRSARDNRAQEVEGTSAKLYSTPPSPYPHIPKMAPHNDRGRAYPCLPHTKNTWRRIRSRTSFLSPVPQKPWSREALPWSKITRGRYSIGLITMISNARRTCNFRSGMFKERTYDRCPLSYCTNLMRY